MKGNDLSRFISRAKSIGIFLSATLLLTYALTQSASATNNLLTNPGAESNGTGWTTILNSGDGMSYNFDGFVRSGTQSFQTSHGLDSIYQTVDLFANGYSANSMRYAPAITSSIWVGTRGDQAGRYYVKFSLLDEDGVTVVASREFGSPTSLLSLSAGTDWTEVTHTFSGYRGGVRYARIEFGGRDQSGWAGHYGTHFDDASLTVASVTETTNSGSGGSSMPSWGYAPPQGPFSLTLKSHESKTNSTEVLLHLSASSDVNRMAISRYADFHDSGIIPFTDSLPWSLCNTSACEPGIHHVYAKFYQSYGVTSPVQDLTIIYEPHETISEVLETHPATTPSSTTASVSSSTVIPFTRNLRPGDQHPDVKRLQEFMNTHGYILAITGNGSPGKETDMFGPALKRALTHFQEANTETLLKPLNLKKGTGFFSTGTRDLVNRILETGN